ncbi:MAG: hypothetical protein R3331_07955 [Sulfurospirillaceae bacterium]|nr:hypothetical protein [Sulfurospirillaceae bacterium]
MKFLKDTPLQDKILNYIFKTSNRPVRFKDLLLANALFNEGMHVDPAKLGFRMIIKNTYIIYAIFCLMILIPVLVVLHIFFLNIDFHISILGTALVTSAIFIGFQYFYSCVRDQMTLKIIKNSWSIHFPYFSYEKYNKEVEKIFNEAMKKEVKKNDLQQYVMDRLSSL